LNGRREKAYTRANREPAPADRSGRSERVDDTGSLSGGGITGQTYFRWRKESGGLERRVRLSRCEEFKALTASEGTKSTWESMPVQGKLACLRGQRLQIAWAASISVWGWFVVYLIDKNNHCRSGLRLPCCCGRERSTGTPGSLRQVRFNRSKQNGPSGAAPTDDEQTPDPVGREDGRPLSAGAHPVGERLTG